MSIQSGFSRSQGASLVLLLSVVLLVLHGVLPDPDRPGLTGGDDHLGIDAPALGRLGRRGRYARHAVRRPPRSATSRRGRTRGVARTSWRTLTWFYILWSSGSRCSSPFSSRSTTRARAARGTDSPPTGTAAEVRTPSRRAPRWPARSDACCWLLAEQPDARRRDHPHRGAHRHGPGAGPDPLALSHQQRGQRHLALPARHSRAGPGVGAVPGDHRRSTPRSASVALPCCWVTSRSRSRSSWSSCAGVWSVSEASSRPPPKTWGRPACRRSGRSCSRCSSRPSSPSAMITFAASLDDFVVSNFLLRRRGQHHRARHAVQRRQGCAVTGAERAGDDPADGHLDGPGTGVRRATAAQPRRRAVQPSTTWPASRCSRPPDADCE